MGGDGGWVGGHRGNAPQQRRDSETLTVYCSQARCPLPGYRCDCVLTSRHSRPQRQGCLCFRPEAGTRVGKAGQEADGGEVGGGGGGVGLRVGLGPRRRRCRCGPVVWRRRRGLAAATAPGLRLFVLGGARGVAGVVGRLGSPACGAGASPLSQRESASIRTSGLLGAGGGGAAGAGAGAAGAGLSWGRSEAGVVRSRVQAVQASRARRQLRCALGWAREVEIALRSHTPRDAPAGRSHAYTSVRSTPRSHIPSARNRPERHIQARPVPGGAPSPNSPKPTLGGFWRGVTRQCRSNRVVSRAFPHPYMMHMLGRGQWARQCSMRSDARVSGEYATKGLIGERMVERRMIESSSMKSISLR